MTAASRAHLRRRAAKRKINPRTAGLVASALKRKEDSRERLLSAALERFCRDGYVAVPVEDIAAAAGVSRVTFYRHFSDKAALAVELFNREAVSATPRFLAIRDAAYERRPAVVQWLQALFAADRENRHMLRVFMQATSDPRFTLQAQQWIAQLIEELGKGVPAFAVRPEPMAQRRRWLEAWLLLYEILDQSNHAALHSGVAHDPLVIDILADRFLGFMRAPAY
jgi:AcrR family transcriptional regulator